MDGSISTAMQFDTFTLNVPKSEVSFFRTMAKKMGWTIEKKKKEKPRMYDPETGEYLNDETMKVIEDSMNGKGIVWTGTAEEFKEWAKAL
ncbi:MAG: hypothetical protein IKD78_03305 [Bacteroidales bacterium]|jgi:hypothetical protein|nr:hypothetical protein [Bacteroidales bacterium]MBR6928769.1 hypothetical protein [Bacteroidales bacterium]